MVRPVPSRSSGGELAWVFGLHGFTGFGFLLVVAWLVGPALLSPCPLTLALSHEGRGDVFREEGLVLGKDGDTGNGGFGRFSVAEAGAAAAGGGAGWGLLVFALPLWIPAFAGMTVVF